MDVNGKKSKLSKQSNNSNKSSQQLKYQQNSLLEKQLLKQFDNESFQKIEYNENKKRSKHSRTNMSNRISRQSSNKKSSPVSQKFGKRFQRLQSQPTRQNKSHITKHSQSRKSLNSSTTSKKSYCHNKRQSFMHDFEKQYRDIKMVQKLILIKPSIELSRNNHKKFYNQQKAIRHILLHRYEHQKTKGAKKSSATSKLSLRQLPSQKSVSKKLLPGQISSLKKSQTIDYVNHSKLPANNSNKRHFRSYTLERQSDHTDKDDYVFIKYSKSNSKKSNYLSPINENKNKFAFPLIKVKTTFDRPQPRVYIDSSLKSKQLEQKAASYILTKQKKERIKNLKQNIQKVRRELKEFKKNKYIL